MQKFQALKIYRRHWFFEFVSPSYHLTLSHRHYHESSDCFEYPQKSLLTSSHPKIHLPNFPTQKILWSSLSLEIQCTPPGSTYQPDIIASENHAYGPSMKTSMHITFLQRQDNIIPNKVLNTRCTWHLYCNAKYHTVGHYYSFTLYNIMQQEKVIKQFMIL